MTDSDYFEHKVRSFLQFCWKWKYFVPLIWLVLVAAIYLALDFRHVEKYKTRLHFPAADYKLWSSTFYSLDASAIFLEKYGASGGVVAGTQPSDAAAGWQPPATADRLAAQLIEQVPLGRNNYQITEINLVTQDPTFIDKVVYPMVEIARDLAVGFDRTRATRVEKVYQDLLSRGNLSQSERDAIDKSRMEFTIENLVREADVASAIGVREIYKNVPLGNPKSERLRTSAFLATLLSAAILLIIFIGGEMLAARKRAQTA